MMETIYDLVFTTQEANFIKKKDQIWKVQENKVRNSHLRKIQATIGNSKETYNLKKVISTRQFNITQKQLYEFFIKIGVDTWSEHFLL